MTFSRRVGEIAAANSKSTVPQSSSSDPHIDIFLLDVEKGIIRSSKTTLLGSLAIHVRNAVISTVNTRNLSDPIPPATIDRWQPSTVVAKYILRNQDWNTKCLTRCGSTADAFAAGSRPIEVSSANLLRALRCGWKVSAEHIVHVLSIGHSIAISGSVNELHLRQGRLRRSAYPRL